MKKVEIKLLCLSMFVLLISITHTSANNYETLVYHEYSELISEGQYADLLAARLDYNLEYSNLATVLVYGSCYEWKRVWVWSGWFPKRVWKLVRVDCPQAATNRGPGTTIPPH